MKKITFTLIILLTIMLSLFSQSKDDSKLREKINKVSPPGTVWMQQNLFMDATEIRNVDYKEYLYWLQKVHIDNPEKYKNAIPDSTVWYVKNGFNEPYVEYYFQHPAYNEYPVVGISYKQAEAYCKWRTDRVHEVILIQKNKLKIEYAVEGKWNLIDSILNAEPLYIEYRLPTEEQWEFAALANMKLMIFPWSGTSLRNREGRFVANFSYVGDENIYYNPVTKKTEILEDKPISPSDTSNLNFLFQYSDYSTASITAPVVSYYPNEFGIYCLAGNVAEMVYGKTVLNYDLIPSNEIESYENTKTILLKGGSWALPGFHCRINASSKYEKPASDVGFRCIAEVLNPDYIDGKKFWKMKNFEEFSKIIYSAERFKKK